MGADSLYGCEAQLVVLTVGESVLDTRVCFLHLCEMKQRHVHAMLTT